MDIKVLKAQGYSQRAVARMMGVHRDTVRRVWNEGEPGKYRRGPRVSKLDGFKEQLVSRLGSHPGLRATRLFREIRGRGFEGGYETVKRWCRSWRREQRVRECWRPSGTAGI
jgi:transposase